jgi:hypothetical protein
MLMRAGDREFMEVSGRAPHGVEVILRRRLFVATIFSLLVVGG